MEEEIIKTALDSIDCILLEFLKELNDFRSEFFGDINQMFELRNHIKTLLSEVKEVKENERLKAREDELASQLYESIKKMDEIL